MSRPMSEAEYNTLAWRLSERPEEGYISDMELYEEGLKLKPEAHEAMDRKAGINYHELEAELASRRAKALKPEPLECPFTENCYCLPKCPLWIQSEAMCSQKLTAIALNQISMSLSQRRR